MAGAFALSIFMSTELQTNKLTQAEDRFIAARESAFANIAETTKAAKELGAQLIALRQELGSEKLFIARLTDIGSRIPYGESREIMKVAARLTTQGSQLMLHRGGQVWAQSAMGILPPAAKHSSDPVEPYKRALGHVVSAAKALASAKLTAQQKEQLGAEINKLLQTFNSIN